jgi:hypothetical protein
VSARELLEQRSVGRKTPLDGRLELSPEAAARVHRLGDEFPVQALGREGVGRLETVECTCGKSPGAKAGERHIHHFVASPLFRELAAGTQVRVDLDEPRGAVLVSIV